MLVPFGENVVDHAASTQRFREAISHVVNQIRTSPPYHKTKVVTVARPRFIELTLRGRCLFRMSLPHRICWMKDQYVMEAYRSSTEAILYGVTGSKELAVKHPVARDCNGNAVLVRKGFGLTELLDTWQLVSQDELSPGLRDYIARGLMATFRQKTWPLI